MTSTGHFSDDHGWVVSQLTDHLTGRADPAAAERVRQHVAHCAACADALAIESRIRQAIRTPATVEYTPGASFAKLKARLDRNAAADAAGRRSWRVRRLAVPLSLAASLAALAISVFSLTARDTPAGTAPFQTLSQAPRTAADLHVGFVDGVTRRDIEQALAPVGGRIVSGPSAAGVYRVATGGVLPLSEAIETLARQNAVRIVAPAPEAADD